MSLDQLAAGPATNNLGTFSAANGLALYNWRYAPLLNDSGNLALVNLSGTNTIRLTIAPPDLNSTRYGLTLNYLVFVPALLVESAGQATGAYSIEPNAVVEPVTRRITLPQNGGTRFYRLSWDHAARITVIKVFGGSVTLSYQ